MVVESAEAREDASAGRVSFSQKGNPYMGACERVLLTVPPPHHRLPLRNPLCAAQRNHCLFSALFTTYHGLAFLADDTFTLDDTLTQLPWLVRENAGDRLAARRRVPSTRTIPAASNTLASAYGTSTKSRTQTLSTSQGRAGSRSCLRRTHVCHTCCACSATSCPSGAAGSCSCRTSRPTFCTLCYPLRHYGTIVNLLVC